MELISSRRGMFFTLLTLIVLVLFVLSYSSIRFLDTPNSLLKRVESLDSFVDAIETDIPRQLYVVGYRFLFLAEKDILERGVFLDDTDASFSEAFFNGTFEGQNTTILVGTTFSDMKTFLQGYASRMNANITFYNPIVALSQPDPWHVRVSLTMHFIVNDLGNVALWNSTRTFYSDIPLSSFDDPLYAVYTNGKVLPKIVSSSYEPFVSGNNISNLSAHLTYMQFIASSNGPSFLGRLEGNFSADSSGNGIESLVNLDALSSQGITVYQKSIVDHLYFSSNSSASCTVLPAGMPSWFRLDSSHLGRYGVSCSG